MDVETTTGPSTFEKVKHSILQGIESLKTQLNQLAYKTNVQINKLIFSIQRRIERFKLNREYRRLKKEEQVAKEELEFQRKQAEINRMKSTIPSEADEPEDLAPFISPNANMMEKSAYIHGLGLKKPEPRKTSSEDLKRRLDQMDQEPEEYEVQLTQNPFRHYPIIQTFMVLLFITGSVLLTLIVTQYTLLEEILPLMSLIVGGVILGLITWRYLFNRFYPKLLHLVVQQRLTRKIFAGGSFSFFGYKDPLKERFSTKFTEPIRYLISTLISMLALATTAAGILRSIDPNMNLISPLLWGTFAFLIPIISAPIIPVIWGLQDAQVKAFNTKNSSNWLVARRYKLRFNSLISITAIYSNLSQGSFTSINSILEQLEILVAILRIGVVIFLLSVSLLVLSYYLGFRSYLRRKTTESLDIRICEVDLIELEVDQFEPRRIKVPEE